MKYISPFFNPGLFFVYFRPFSHYNFNTANLKKCRRCARDSNLQPQDGRRRQYHGAMAAAQIYVSGKFKELFRISKT